MKEKSKKRFGALEIFSALVCTLAVTWVEPARADLPEVVVSANRIETEVKKVGSSVTVITAEELAERQQFSVLEVLKSVPGIDVVRSGGSGGNTAVFLRGANSEHTLVLIDGVEANNPINPQRSFNFADLTVENVERIEILRGPQTTLYGSDALGGVIQIFTKKGTEDSHLQMSTEIGSYDTYHESVNGQGTHGALSYSLGFARVDRQGMSAVVNPGGETENDKYENSTGSMHLGLKATDDLDFQVTGRITNSHSEIDNGPGVGDDDPNRMFNSNQYTSRVAANLSLFDGMLKQTYGANFSGTNFSDNNDPDPDHLKDLLRSNFKGSELKFDFLNTLTLSDEFIILAGMETEEEQGSSTFFSDGDFGPFSTDFSEKEVRTNGIFGQVSVEPQKNLVLVLGGRVDDNSRFGTRENWRFTPSYFIEHLGTRFKGSVGTAYKAPSLYQLFSEFGRLDLQPERSLGFDAGFEQEIGGEKTVAGVTYFHNNFKELISFDPNTFIFENILSARTQGFESFIKLQPLEEVGLRLNYTYLDTKDNSTGLRLLRRANQRVNINLDVKPCDKLDTHLTVLIVGTRADNDFSAFPSSRVQLQGYATVNLAAEYQLNKQISIFTHADNIFDKDYEEILGYNTPGAALYGGLRFELN